MENITGVVEAILFAVGRSVSVKEFKEVLGVNVSEVEAAIHELEEKYNGNSGISLVKFNDEYQLVSNKSYFEQVSKFV